VSGLTGRAGLPALACCLALTATILAACLPAADAAPILKIGLVAPFEGLERPFGYAVLPAVKLAIADANASGELGPYRAALVALNDDGDPATAAGQVRTLAQDSDVRAVLGPWDAETARTAVSAYSMAGLPALVGAPLAGPPPGIRSLCPSPETLANALVERAGQLGDREPATAGPDTELRRALEARASLSLGAETMGTRVYAGSAEAAADDLAHWRALGWRGALLGGPDVARSWLIGRAGMAVEGVEAATCVLPGEVPASLGAGYQSGAGTAPATEAALAYAGTRLLLQALSQDIRANRQSSRAGTAAALAGLPFSPGLQWLRVQGGRWVISE
jgi:ABC-type branched-subunit amino acid transport system substrate-binding protein